MFASIKEVLPKNGLNGVPDITLTFVGGVQREKKARVKKIKKKKTQNEIDLLNSFFIRPIDILMMEEKEKVLQEEEQKELSLGTITNESNPTPKEEILISTPQKIEEEPIYYDSESFEEEEVYFTEDSIDQEYGNYEVQCHNIKRNFEYVRSKQYNKKEKVNYERYVRSWKQQQEADQKAFESYQFTLEKQNRYQESQLEIQMLNSQRIREKDYLASKCKVKTSHSYSQVKSRPAPIRNNRHNNTPYIVNGRHAANSRADIRNLQLSADVLEQLVQLQFKELTPEDYELLLALDESVKPKTVQKSDFSRLKTSTLTSTSALLTSGSLCPICIVPYVVGDKITTLPCSHPFHSTCIEYWLTNSSVNCPCDNLPVFN